MGWLDAEGYELARQVLQRGIAATYLIAFISTYAQFPALLGARGLLPAPAYLQTPSSQRQPTLFHWVRYTDARLRVLAGAGAVLSALLVLGVPQLGVPWLPLASFLAIWLAYLSIVSIGQTFYAFGWESLLLEAGFVAAFLGSNSVAPPIAIVWLFRWLVFRLEFGAGMIKLRGDAAWRDLTAMLYHHETQPMPNPLSRWAHLLPRWFHRCEVVGNHLCQLVVPFLLFAPQPVASCAAAVIVLSQLWLMVTGNFAWLNALTIVLAFSAIADPAVHAVVPAMPSATSYHGAPAFTVLTVAAAVLLIALSWWPAQNLLSRNQLMNASFNRWHLVNAYGAFGSVTRRRSEVIVEGSEVSAGDALPPESSWRPYAFKGKPGDPRRIPVQCAPYHLRLDWLMWFLALGSSDTRWFHVLLLRLLRADRATLRLLRSDPFDGRPPGWVRARIADYRYATRAERKETGLWWIVSDPRILVPPVRLGADGRPVQAPRPW